MCCCIPYSEVIFEEPPKKSKKGKNVEEPKDYVLVSSDFNVQPITSPSPIYYPDQSQLFRSRLAAPVPNYGDNSKNNGPAGANGIRANGASQRLQFVPEVPSGNTTYWCKELDGSWHVRTTNDIMINCQPGDWRKHTQTGFPYFVRRAAA